MEKDLRYNMQHLGDIVTDALGKFFGCFKLPKLPTRGIVLTYKIHELKKKRREILTDIGEELENVKLRSPELSLFSEENMVKLFNALKSVEEQLEECQQKREEKLHPGRVTVGECEAV